MSMIDNQFNVGKALLDEQKRISVDIDNCLKEIKNAENISMESAKKRVIEKHNEKLAELRKKAGKNQGKVRTFFTKLFRDTADLFRDETTQITKLMESLKNEEVEMNHGFIKDDDLNKMLNIDGKKIDLMHQTDKLFEYCTLVSNEDTWNLVAEVIRSSSGTIDGFRAACGQATEMLLEKLKLNEEHNFKMSRVFSTEKFIGNRAIGVAVDEHEGIDIIIDTYLFQIYDNDARQDQVPLMPKRQLIDLVEFIDKISNQVFKNANDVNVMFATTNNYTESFKEPMKLGAYSDQYAYGMQAAQWVMLMAWGNMLNHLQILIKYIKKHFNYQDF